MIHCIVLFRIRIWYVWLQLKREGLFEEFTFNAERDRNRQLKHLGALTLTCG